MSPFTVTEKAMRPASAERRCFYCHQDVGATHNDDCVLINRKVRVRLTIEYDIEVPAFWDPGTIEHHRNASSWCANNALSELDAAFPNGCMCGSAEFAFLRETDGIKYLDE